MSKTTIIGRGASDSVFQFHDAVSAVEVLRRGL